MALTEEYITEVALKLSADERERLAETLLASVRDDPEWDAEAERRYQRYRAGEVVAIPAAEALAELRARRRK